jgi:Ca-activated chloride channel homolog
MTKRLPFLFVFLTLLSCSTVAQVLSIPMPGVEPGGLGAYSMDAIQASQMDFNVFRIDRQNQDQSLLQSPSASVSKLDLKAPWKAKREYAVGFRLLMRKDMTEAVDHLQKAAAIYPSFVAAHNALGTAYLNLNQNEQARDEFNKAIVLDDHLPNSYLNLGCAQLALKDYPAAEEALKKASSIAPLDLQLQLAVAYGEFQNHDYPGVIATAQHVHEVKHDKAAAVHFFAAGAWEALGNLENAQHEMETLLREDPQSASADQFRQILTGIHAEEQRQAEAKLHPASPAQTVTFSFNKSVAPTAGQASQQARQILQNVKERNEIAEAEAASDATCGDCGTSVAAATTAFGPMAPNSGSKFSRTTFRSAVDEVAIFFAATDHGKSASNLTIQDIQVRDDNHPPHAILDFRNESQLPLRIGLVIDTSNSVLDRFSFEQAAATKFLQAVATNKQDLSFVIGVSSSVLLVQDFTADQARTAHAISELAPGGGTALWNAVAFAADKLAGHKEDEAVARVLVVVSDGQDNSSDVSFREAIAHAQRAEVAVYTVSTRDSTNEDASALLGEHALRTLSELTGGAAFAPGSIHRFKGSLVDLQQVIRGRYLISYQPASFQRDGRYRPVNITAAKDGHTLKIYARKGYYASAPQTSSYQ